MKVKKVLKQFNFTQLVELVEPVYGGKYAVIKNDQVTDGLCLDAANDLYITLKKLSNFVSKK